MESSLDDLLAWADHVVIAQKPSESVATKIKESGLPVLDLIEGRRSAPAMSLV